MTESEFIYLGALLAFGFITGEFVERVGVPRVAGYVAAGALFSESLIGAAIPGEPGAWGDHLTNISLAIIAFIVGTEMDVDRLRRLGRAVLIITVGQSLGTLVVVTLALCLFSTFATSAAGFGWNVALVLGAIATATAPAATLAVIDEYKASGDMTSTLLGVVAVDDALGIMLFTVAVGFAGAGGIGEQLAAAAIEIGLAVAAGAALGVVLGSLERHITNGDLRLSVIIGFIILNFGFSGRFHYSDLLSGMVLGLVAMIIFKRPQREWRDPLEHIRDTIFLVFFTLAGTHFAPLVLLHSLPLILVYVLARVAGKYAGSYAAASFAGSDSNIRNYLGLALLPHAGVAVGLALLASSIPELSQFSAVLLNTIIGSTIIFALGSPWLTRHALKKAGEISGRD